MMFASRDVSVRLEDTLAGCPYYRNVGTQSCDGRASCGYSGEPRCITDEPAGGWEAETFTPSSEPNPILVAFREDLALMPWSSTEAALHYRARVTSIPGVSNVSLDHIMHARKVLAHLAALGATS